MSRPGPDRRVSDLEIIQAMKRWMALTGEPCIKAGEVAVLVQIETQQVRDRLKKLHKQELVEYKHAGSGKVWWLV